MYVVYDSRVTEGAFPNATLGVGLELARSAVQPLVDVACP